MTENNETTYQTDTYLLQAFIHDAHIKITESPSLPNTYCVRHFSSGRILFDFCASISSTLIQFEQIVSKLSPLQKYDFKMLLEWYDQK